MGKRIALVYLVLCTVAVLIGAGCRTPQAQEAATTVKAVAGDLVQQIEQQTGVDSVTVGKVGVVFVGWILSLCLFSFLLPNPKKGWLVGAILCVAVVLSIGLPLAMFFR